MYKDGTRPQIAHALFIILAIFFSVRSNAQLETVHTKAPSCTYTASLATSPEFAARTVIVTGGSSGIGLKTVELLAASGAQAVIFDRHYPVEPIATTGQVFFYKVDVSREKDLKKGFSEVRNALGRIEGVVANAGIHASGTILDTTADEFDAVMQVNLHGTFLTAKLAVEHMMEQHPDGNWGRGSIVITGSDQSVVGKARSLAYGTSKAALAGFVRSSALAIVEEGIRINLVCPGTTDTPFLNDAAQNHSKRYDLALPGMKQTWADGIPGGRFVTPMEVAQAITYLLSGPRSSGSTGSLLMVDRGTTAQ